MTTELDRQNAALRASIAARAPPLQSIEETARPSQTAIDRVREAAERRRKEQRAATPAYDNALVILAPPEPAAPPPAAKASTLPPRPGRAGIPPICPRVLDVMYPPDAVAPLVLPPIESSSIDCSSPVPPLPPAAAVAAPPPAGSGGRGGTFPERPAEASSGGRSQEDVPVLAL